MEIENKKILITGASGMVGAAVRSLLPHAFCPTRKELNLLSQKDVESYFNAHSFDAVIHLAAKVGGVQANTKYVADFYAENILMNTNVLRSSVDSKVKKVVSLLSTCVYPDNPQYPLTEDQLHSGPPHSSNYGYAYAKRMLEVQSRTLQEQHGLNFICAIPNNLYGENDNFDLENGHVIPALMRRIWEAKLAGRDSVVAWGDGTPRREFTYSKDIAEILIFLLQEYDKKPAINIGSTEEYSIREVAEAIKSNLGFTGQIIWDSHKPSGQFRKPSSNELLISSGWDKDKYTPLKNGLKKACKWFMINYPHNTRGV